MLYFFKNIQFPSPEDSNHLTVTLEARVFKIIIKRDIPFLQQQGIIDYSFLMRVVPHNAEGYNNVTPDCIIKDPRDPIGTRMDSIVLKGQATKRLYEQMQVLKSPSSYRKEANSTIPVDVHFGGLIDPLQGSKGSIKNRIKKVRRQARAGKATILCRSNGIWESFDRLHDANVPRDGESS